MDLSHLNPSQRSAVEHVDGPLLVLAGAGSGKTRVITHRVVRLLELGIVPERIVALSFTNKAAGEMRERLSGMVGASTASALTMGTFHSLGAWMMREDPTTFGLPGARFSILDQGDVYGIVRSLLREHGHHATGGDRRFDLGAVVQRISLWKNDFVQADDLESLIVDEYDVVAASIYEPYEERLQALGGVDFDDLVCRIAHVLRHDEAARDRWQGRFDYLMVDEYQDTNGAQLALLRGLTRPPHNLAVVGDDDQAIYGWRGAKVENILNFDHHFPGAHVIKLQENYRSRAPILRTANSVVQHNDNRHDKELVVTRGEGEPVHVVVAADGAFEASWVGSKIRRMVVDDRIAANEVAVLYRSALQAKLIEEELQQHGVPYRVLGGQSMYDKKEVKDAQAYLKVLVMPRDELALRRALETPPRGIGNRSLQRMTAWCRANNSPLIEAVHKAREVPDLPSRATEALGRFSSLVRRHQARTREAGVSAALSEMLGAVQLQEHVRKEQGSDAAADNRWKGVKWLMGSIDRYEQRMRGKGKAPRWAEYLGTVALDNNQDNDDDKAKLAIDGKVTLATLHSSKGLEWDQVFILGLEEGTMPHRRVASPRASDAIAGDLEEERRLFYVGITRARERLWLTRSAGRIDRGREIAKVPSRFLEELPDDGSVKIYEIEKEEEMTSNAMDDMASAFLAQIRPPE
ncbi:MAG: UvrD-helicase domain-containing protein [Deltaproteobacteria bacterium]|nr:UvrD-helicase domain-containing protein [Deltaproteobacteria bacterium]